MYGIYIISLYDLGGLKGFDWGPYLSSGGAEAAPVSYFKHVCMDFAIIIKEIYFKNVIAFFLEVLMLICVCDISYSAQCMIAGTTLPLG